MGVGSPSRGLKPHGYRHNVARVQNQFATFLTKQNQSTFQTPCTRSCAGQPRRLGRLKPILRRPRWAEGGRIGIQCGTFLTPGAKRRAGIFGPTTDRRLPPRNCLPARKIQWERGRELQRSARRRPRREDHDPRRPDAKTPAVRQGRGPRPRRGVRCRSSSRRGRHGAAEHQGPWTVQSQPPAPPMLFEIVNVPARRCALTARSLSRATGQAIVAWPARP